mmetsp:Transcript_9828/g.19321  ORF Transcript_9828/g.19321 Transcript_9828/m.19321 type:complete len:232 (-) Transcript_9828:97-792(-)|eukprot:CAMPEP_0171495818 /NCGR_PEP_ID=MMETSP0958-20121227/6351_1 /TAXON_ID=87120 /ORGANISM="Aurantiochytrium limacinum, Strain ATCCMYA-1381" /LENGTH=231 /DNA_ID=CAMNT_0012029839 /DNA_START=177 /DNA_END=872 /DNA_ORIENTATION=-
MACLRYFFALAFAVFMTVHEATAIPAIPPKKPTRTDYAAASRWLVCASDWGVLASDGSFSNQELRRSSSSSSSIPYADIAAYGEGVVHRGRLVNCTGEPYFYLRNMSAVPRDLAQNSWGSLTVSMAGLRAHGLFPYCTTVNAEDPTCWRATLTGLVEPVMGEERDRALTSLFSRHLDMKFWPSSHNFVVYKLSVKKLFFLDFYGYAHHISIEDYLGVDLDSPEIKESLASA